MKGVSVFEARSIASVLSGNLRVTIKESNQGWHYNFDQQCIYYDKDDLYRLDQFDVAANLLHEAGHAKYSSPYIKMKWPVKPIISFGNRAKLHTLTNAIEDHRVEDLIRAYYPYAKDYLPLASFKAQHELNEFQKRATKTPDGKPPKYLQYCVGAFAQLGQFSLDESLMDRDVIVALKKTEAFITQARHAGSTQEVVTIIATSIYPYIKKFLEEYEQPKDAHDIYLGIATEGKMKRAYPTYPELYADIKKLIAPTVETFNRILTDNKFDKLEGRYRTGDKLNERKLYKFGIPDFRLFQRRVEAKNKHYRFALVVDESGSMSGRKTVQAAKSAVLFAHVLEKLEIPYSLHGFNKSLRTYKRHNEAFSKKTQKSFEQMMENTQTDDASDNNDGLAIHTFGRQMLGDSGKRVMFVLSDGQPAESMEGMGYPLPETVKRVQSKGIEMVGIGIISSAVTAYYATNAVIKTVDELPRTLLQQLKRKLKA